MEEYFKEIAVRIALAVELIAAIRTVLNFFLERDIREFDESAREPVEP